MGVRILESRDGKPRDRFKQAIASILENDNTAVLDAIKAFVDAECQCIHDSCFDCAGWDNPHEWATGCSHDFCRSEFLKEFNL